MDSSKDMLYLNHMKYNYVKEIFQKIPNIPYAVIKGEPLSLAAYGKFGCRGFGDIDFLLPRRYLNIVENTLLSLGFQTRFCNRNERVFLMSCAHQVGEYTKCYDNIMNVEIDLNFDIFWGEYVGKPIDIENFLLDVVNTSIHDIKVKTLSPMKAMIQLALHHYKDMNSIFLLATKKSIKYNMFKDFYFLFKRNIKDIPLDSFYSLCKTYDIIPYIYYIFYFTNLLYEDDALVCYRDKFYCKDGEELLDYYGLSNSEKKRWKVDFFTRINSNDIYSIIKSDLTDKDFEKININKKFFGT